MTDFKVLLIGESDFTNHFINRFQGELKLCLVKNSCFNIDISEEFIPRLAFLPEGEKTTIPYAQICSDNFRVDLLHNTDIINLFFEKELKCRKPFFDNLIIDSATNLHLLNSLIFEYYTKGLIGFIKDKPLFFLKNYKTFINLSKNISPPSSEFDRFLKGLLLLFSPGEVNSGFYKKYLLYSIINKAPYRIKSEKPVDYKNIEVIENKKLLELVYYKSYWKLRFEDTELLADMIISAFPPHIYSFSHVSTPFRIDYENTFYEFLIRDIKTPVPMADELVFNTERGIFYALKKENALSIFAPAKVNEKPESDFIKPFIDEFIPYFSLRKSDINVKYTGLVYHNRGRFRIFRKNRTCRFPKCYDFPYYGADGEILYRNTLSELIWKKFLL